MRNTIDLPPPMRLFSKQGRNGSSAMTLKTSRKTKRRRKRKLPKQKTFHVVRASLRKKTREWRGLERGDGFVIIQVDGLPHQVLMKALSEGYMPFMRNLLNSGMFNISSYHCGIPGNTPAAQSGIMYGENKGIPAFRWLDKEEDTLISFKNPLSAQLVESRIAAGREGILKNGSSYVNLLSGGAARSVFTLSTFLRQDMQQRLSGLAIFCLFAIHIVPVLRMIASSVIELAREFLEYLEIRLKGGLQKSEGFFPLVRIFSNVLFYEVGTVGAVIDIKQGRRSIYLTYNGYDEAAHQRGPETKYALKALRVIDLGIRKVVKQALKKKKGMRYDIYILSDHGNHPAIPFHYKYGETLENFIYSKVEEGRITQYDTGSGQVKDYLMTALSSTLHSFAEQNLFFMRRLFKQLANYIDRNIGQEERLKTLENITIVNSSSMSNLYFNLCRKRVEMEEVERAYPGLIGALVRHKGIGLLVARSEGNVVLLSRKGRMFLNKDFKKIDGENPLKDFQDSDALEQEILHQFSEIHAGDLVLYGAINDSHVISFEEQMGGHGGIGGMQNTPFILYPQKIRFPFHEVRNTRELYRIFSRYARHQD